MTTPVTNFISTDDNYIKQYQRVLTVEEHNTMCGCESCKLARSCAYRLMQSLHEHNKYNLLAMQSMYSEVRSMIQ